MTVAVEAARIVHTGNGVTTNWPYPFPVLDADDMQVYLYEIATGIVTGPLSDTLYTVNEVGEDDGSVDYPLVGSPLAATHKIILLRRVDMLQPYNFNTASGFDPAALTEQLDLMTMMIQQVADDADRAVKVDVSGTRDPDDVLTDMEAAVAAAAASAAAASTSETNAAQSETGAETAKDAAEAAQAAAEAAAASFDSVVVTSRTALKALDTGLVRTANLTEAGREGIFVWKTGNYSTQITADAQEGIYVKADAVASASGAWVREYSGLPSVKWFGAVMDGTTDDTVAAQAAIDVGGIAFVPPGTMKVIQLTLGSNEGLIGAARGLSIIKGSGTTTTIVVSAGATGPQVQHLTIDKVSGVTPTDGGAIQCLGSCQFAYFDNLILTNHYRGLILGATGWSRAENIICTTNYNHGVLMLNTAGVNAAQWQLYNILSQMNDGMGFCVLSVAGTTQMNLGQWTKLATFANTSYGVFIQGNASYPVQGLRLSDSFFGQDGNTELYLDTHGGPHHIDTSYFELAGTTLTGRTLATAASGVGSGIQVTANNTIVAISDSTATGNSVAGFNLAAATFNSVNDNKLLNNGTYGLIAADGAKTILNGNLFTGNVSGSLSITANRGSLIPSGNLPLTVNGYTVLSVKDFGAVGDGSTNDTTAINAAIAAAALTGRAVFFPAGTYNVTSLTTLPAGTRLIGENRDASIIRTTSATANVITVDADTVTIEGLKFMSTVTRSGVAGSTGNYIYIDNDAWHIVVKGCWFEGAFVGIYSGNALNVMIRENVFWNAVPNTGMNIYVDYTFALHIEANFMVSRPENSPHNHSHIYINRCGDTNITGCQLIRAQYDMYVAPGNGHEADSIRVAFTYFDSYTARACYFIPSGTGLIQRCDFVQCWFSGGTGNGFHAVASASAIVRGVSFTSCHFLGTSDSGAALVGANVSQIEFTDCKFAGNTSVGLYIDAATDIKVNGGTIGSWGGFGVNATGVSIVGAADRIHFANCDLDSNTSDINLTTTGLDISFVNCRGYNGWRAWTPTITSGTGTITTKSATAFYKREGKNVLVSISITVTTNGTGATNLQFTLPFTCVTGKEFCWAGAQSGTGHMTRCLITSAALVGVVQKYDGSYPAVDGSVIRISGVYESA